MPRQNKIRQAGRESRVRKLVAKGLTYRQIADELKKEGLDVSHVAVGRFLNEETEERREAARSVAAQGAKESVPLVTGKLSKWVGFIDELIEDAMKQHRTSDHVDVDEKPSDRVARRARMLGSASEDVARLVNAGTKAAKTLHDITVGDRPDDPLSAIQAEAMSILAEKRRREAEDEA